MRSVATVAPEKLVETADQRLVVYGVPWSHFDRFERAVHSRLFPGLDLDLLVSLLDRPTVIQAVRALHQALDR